MDYLTEGTKLVNGRRGVLLDSIQSGERMALIADVPVAEMFGFEAALKSATAGRGFQSLIDVSYKKLPSDLQMTIVQRIRERKGLPKELPKPILD
jgi:elongation factor 2